MLACVPYPPEHSDEVSNFGYRRLVNNLDLIRTMPEVLAFPPLEELLLIINVSGSLLETIGCGPGAFRRKNEPEVFYAGTYLHVVFRSAPLNFGEANYERLGKQLGEAWRGCLGVGVDLTIDPLADYFGEWGALALKIEIAGRGPTLEAAWERAGEGVAAFADGLRAADLAPESWQEGNASSDGASGGGEGLTPN